jgi:hypothetical protein
MSPTDLAVQNQPGSTATEGSTLVEERPDKTEPVDRVKKDSADTEKKPEGGWKKPPVGLIDLMR